LSGATRITAMLRRGSMRSHSRTPADLLVVLAIEMRPGVPRSKTAKNDHTVGEHGEVLVVDAVPSAWWCVGRRHGGGFLVVHTDRAKQCVAGWFRVVKGLRRLTAIAGPSGSPSESVH